MRKRTKDKLINFTLAIIGIIVISYFLGVINGGLFGLIWAITIRVKDAVLIFLSENTVFSLVALSWALSVEYRLRRKGINEQTR